MGRKKRRRERIEKQEKEGREEVDIGNCSKKSEKI